MAGDRRGATAIEYGVIASIVVLVGVVAVRINSGALTKTAATFNGAIATVFSDQSEETAVKVSQKRARALVAQKGLIDPTPTSEIPPKGVKKTP